MGTLLLLAQSSTLARTCESPVDGQVVVVTRDTTAMFELNTESPEKHVAT